MAGKPEESSDIAKSGKKSPNGLLVVDKAVNNDSSVISMHPDTMEKLQLFRGDTVVLIKGKESKDDTISVAVADKSCEQLKIRMTKAVRSHLRVRVGDVVSVHQCPDDDEAGGGHRKIIAELRATIGPPPKATPLKDLPPAVVHRLLFGDGTN